MWGPLCLLWMLTWSALGAPSPTTLCPEDCECSATTKNGINAHCSSLNFLNELGPKQLHDITELHLNGLSIKVVDHRFKKLRNLRKLNLSNNRIEILEHFPQLNHLTHLDLSGNRLEKFTADSLPKSIKHLDVSSNRILVLSKDVMKYLPNLREVNLNGNPLTCECDFIKDRDYFLRNDVHIVRPANCYTPENVRDISWLNVYCVSGKVTYDDLGQMLADEPGSGEDVGGIIAASTSSDFYGFDHTEDDVVKDNDDLEREYFPIKDDNSSASDSVEDLVEGSGSAYSDVNGSGDGEYIPVPPDPQVPHCYYNCSTPPPNNETNVSEPPANVGEEVSRFFGVDAQTTTTTERATTTTQVPVQEDVVEKSAATLSKTVPKEQTDSRANVEAPKESQTTQDVSKKNNTTTFVVVAVLLVALVALVAFVVVKKRNARNSNNRRPISNHEVKEPPAVEMKPLMSQSVPYKPSPLPERTPLINRQNGTNKNSDQDDQTDAKVDPPVENGLDNAEEEEPQIRPKKEDDALLTPGTKRVTIQAKELSSPKSPVLVQRLVGNDGKIVSSPVSNEFKPT